MKVTASELQMSTRKRQLKHFITIWLLYSPLLLNYIASFDKAKGQKPSQKVANFIGFTTWNLRIIHKTDLVEFTSLHCYALLLFDVDQNHLGSLISFLSAPFCYFFKYRKVLMLVLKLFEGNKSLWCLRLLGWKTFSIEKISHIQITRK